MCRPVSVKKEFQPKHHDDADTIVVINVFEVALEDAARLLDKESVYLRVANVVHLRTSTTTEKQGLAGSPPEGACFDTRWWARAPRTCVEGGT